MANFSVTGLEGLEDFFGNIEAIPNSVINKMLHAQADIVVQAQKKTAKSMLSGPRSTGQTAESITKGKIKNTKHGKQIKIIFEGNRTRGGKSTANSEIAFINEFGTSKQTARPFIRTANEKCADEAAEVAGRIFDEFLDSL